jgi:hypothetical protein
MEECRFWDAELFWNGRPLPLILDHISGNSRDNSPQNLQLLCPNCDSQQETRGGRNIGRIQNESSGAYEIVRSEKRRDAKVFPSGVSATATAGPIVKSSDEKT